jgi:hypothetical protein
LPAPGWNAIRSTSRCTFTASGASTCKLNVVTWLPVPLAFTSMVDETATAVKPVPSALLVPSSAKTGERPPGWFVHRLSR